MQRQNQNGNPKKKNEQKILHMKQRAGHSIFKNDDKNDGKGKNKTKLASEDGESAPVTKSLFIY